MNTSSIGSFIGNDKFAKFAKGTAGAVVVMTGIKALGRPYFIYNDKNADEGKKKYAATSEFLYQVVCLGVTVAILPLFQRGGLALAKKFLKGHESKFIDEGFAVLKKEAEEIALKKGKQVKKIKRPEKLTLEYFNAGLKSILKPYKEASEILEQEGDKLKCGLVFDSKKAEAARITKEKATPIAEAAHKVKGLLELGSFVGSVLGLTLLAPPIAHALTHPMMKTIGMDKKESANPALERLQQPILSEGHHKKVDTTV